MGEVVEGIRGGGGPVVVEAATYRWHGHYEGDPQRYRAPEELEEWKARDPLVAHVARLRDAGVGDDAIASLEATVASEPDAAVEAASSEERPLGKVWCRTVRFRWSPSHENNTSQHTNNH